MILYLLILKREKLEDFLDVVNVLTNVWTPESLFELLKVLERVSQFL